jgi:hypothetical protein
MKTKELIGEIRDIEVVDKDGCPVARTSLKITRDGNIVAIYLASSALPNACMKLAAGQEIPDLIQIVNGETSEVLNSRLVQEGGWLRVGVFLGSRMISLEFPPGDIYVQVERIVFREILARI